MPTNDFFLDFGSNASTFGTRLARDLKSARAEISGFGGELDDLNEKLTTTASRMVTIARARKGQTPEPRQQPAAAGRTTGGGAGGDDAVKHLIQDIGEYNTSLTEMVNKIGVVVEALSPITAQVKKDRDKLRRQKAGQKSYQTRLDNGDGPNAQGQVTKKGSGTNPPSIRDTGRKNKPVEVTILGTPTGLIDEAIFKRVVSALEKNTAAVKANTAAGGKGVRAAEASGGGGVAAGTIRNQIGKRQQLAALKQELARTQSGGEFDAGAFAAAAGGRKRLVERGERMGHTGPEWEAQLTKTIKQLEKDLKGVPRVKALKNQLADGGGSGSAAVTTAATNLTKEQRAALAAQVEANNAQMEVIDAEIRGLREEAAGEKATRKQKKATRQAELAAAKEAEQAAKGDSGLTGTQRANVAAHLDIANSEDMLRKQPKGRLREIASSVQGEGGAVGFNPTNTKLTNEKLIQGILAGAKQIREAGKTFHDLTTKKQADDISRMATLVAGKLREDRKISPTEQQAYELRKQSRQSGGEDEPFKGRQQVGGDFQQGQGSRWVHGAQAAINERNNVRLPTAAIDAALENMSRGRNVYSDKIKATGGSEDVRETKAALSAIRRATDAIDSMVDEFDELPGAIRKAEKAVEELKKDAASLKTPANITNQGRRATLFNQINQSTANEATRQKKIDELRAIGGGTKTVEFTKQHDAQLKDLNAAIKAEAAARRELRKKIVKETTDPGTMDMNERLKNQIARSLQKGKVLESQAANLRGIRSGTVTTGTGLNEKQQAALTELVNAQVAEAAARKKAEAELKKLSGGMQRNTQAEAKLAAAEDKLATLRAKQVAMGESEEGGFVGGLAGSQKYRTGRAARDAHRATLDTPEARKAKEDAAARAYARMEESQASLMGLGGVLGGPRTKQRATKNERESLYGFPGLQQSTRPGAHQGELRFTSQASPVGDPAKLAEINKSLKSYVAVQKRIGELSKAEVKDVEQIALLKKQALNDAQQMINAYDEMGLQDKLGIGARRVHITDDGQLGYRGDAGPTQNTARRRRIPGESEADYKARLDSVTKQTAADRKRNAAAKKEAAAAQTSTEAAEIHQQAANTDVRAAKEKNQAVNKSAAASARAGGGGATPPPGAPPTPGAPPPDDESKRKKREADARNALRTDTSRAAVMDKLSAATKREITELARMKTEGAAANVIAEQQVKVYAMMTNELAKLKLNTSAIRQGFQSVSAGAGVPVTHGETNNIARSANMRGMIQGQAKQMGNEAENVRDVIAQKLFGNHGFWSRVANSTGTFVIRNFTAGLVFGLTAALSDVVKQAIETESTFARVSSALEATGRSAGNLRTQLQGISTEYGVALEDVYTTAAGLVGVFDDVNDVAFATKVAAQLELISRGALNATEAMGALSSITSAFGSEVGGTKGLEHIADVLTVIQNRIGVNIEVTAEGVGRLAGLADQIGLTFEQTAVFVGEIAKKTNQTGEAAGEQFSRIIAVMQSGRGQKVLTDTFGGTGIDNALTNGDYGAAIEIVMKNYEKLTDVQQQNLNVTLGGQRQAAAISALFKDGAKALDTVRAAQYSKGEADKRAGQIINNLNTAMKKFQSNLVNLGAALVRSGALDFFGALLIGVNATLGGLNTFLSTLNDIADSNSFIRFISRATIAIIGMGIALKVLKAGFAGIKAFVKSSPAMEAGVRAAQESASGAGGTSAVGRGAAAARARVRQGLIDATTISARPSMTRAQLPMTAPTTMLGKGLEKVTAGPLKAFGSGLTRLSTMLTTVSTAQSASGFQGSAGRSALLSRGSGALGRGFNRFGTGMESFLRGGVSGAALTGRASVGLGNYATQLAQRATIARSAVGAGPLAGAGLSAGAKAATAASASMRGLSGGLRLVATNGALAQGAMVGLAAVIIAVGLEMKRSADFAKDTQKAYEAVFGEGRGKTEEELAKEKYIGPATDLVKKNQEGLGGFGGFMRAFGQTFNPQNAFRDVGEIGDRAAGNASIEDLNKNDTSWRKGLDRIKAARKNATGNIEDQIQQIRDAAASGQDDLAARAAEIEADSSTSGEQKATLLSDLEKSKKNIEDIAASQILAIQGLDSLSKMTSDRIAEIAGLAGFFQNSPTAGANNAAALDALINYINPASGGQALKKNFDVLAKAQGSTSDLLQAQIGITQSLLDAATANLNTLTDPDQLKQASQDVMTYTAQVEAYKRQAIDAEIATANEMATFLSGAGNYGGAADELKSAAENLRQKVAASNAQKAKDAKGRPGFLRELLGGPKVGGPGQGAGVLLPRSDVFTDDETTAKLNQARAAGSAGVDLAITGANRDNQLLLDNQRNNQTIADLQVKIAKEKARQVAEAFAVGNKTQDELDAANREVIQALNNQADTAQANTQAKYAVTSAGLLNGVAKSRSDEAAAWQAVAYASKTFGKSSTEYLSALAAAKTASQGTTQSILDELQAQRETELAMIAPADAVGRAQKTLANAQAAQRDAARFGQSSVQYQQATQAVIEAQRGVNDSIAEVADANSNLAITLAAAAGKTVDVARLKLEQAQKELARAREKSGGAVTAATINAEANVKQSQADLRDATLQDRLDTIDFQKNMDQITSRGAISMLTELLNMKDLTEQQRRDILLKIKGLQDELSASMEGAFNLPSTIKPPTVYEVRRALGIDDYLKTMKDATDLSSVTGAGASSSAQNQILREIQQGMAANGRAVPTQSQDYSNSNNNVTINGASFDDVISWLQQYLGSGAQVVRTVTPRRY